jgi:hypothetical protein
MNGEAPVPPNIPTKEGQLDGKARVESMGEEKTVVPFTKN